MELKQIKRLAEALDDSGKQELVYFLQFRMKSMSAPVRVIDEIQEQKHKKGLDCPHCDSHSVVRFGSYVIKHYLAWFRFIDNKDYENTKAIKKHMLVTSCLFRTMNTNSSIRMGV